MAPCGQINGLPSEINRDVGRLIVGRMLRNPRDVKNQTMTIRKFERAVTTLALAGHKSLWHDRVREHHARTELRCGGLRGAGPPAGR